MHLECFISIIVTWDLRLTIIHHLLLIIVLVIIISVVSIVRTVIVLVFVLIGITCHVPSVVTVMAAMTDVISWLIHAITMRIRCVSAYATTLPVLIRISPWFFMGGGVLVRTLRGFIKGCSSFQFFLHSQAIVVSTRVQFLREEVIRILILHATWVLTIAILIRRVILLLMTLGRHTHLLMIQEFSVFTHYRWLIFWVIILCRHILSAVAIESITCHIWGANAMPLFIIAS